MANQQHLDLINRDSIVWNSWKKKHPKISVDLSGADLSAAGLSGANLSKAQLSAADLKEASLKL